MTSQSIIENGAPLGNHYMTWPERESQLNKITKWNAQGSVAVHNNQKGWNASFNWQQQPDNYSLAFFGPLGSYHTQLTGNTNQVTLTTSDGHTYSANSPEMVLQKQLGWTLPVSSLKYWLKGLPAPHAAFGRSFDLNKHLVHLRQSGWDILYLRYLSINGVDLPDRFLLSSPQWQVRIVITQWQI